MSDHEVSFADAKWETLKSIEVAVKMIAEKLPPAKPLDYIAEHDQVVAWNKVFDLCVELGMDIDSERCAIDAVLKFIREK